MFYSQCIKVLEDNLYLTQTNIGTNLQSPSKNIYTISLNDFLAQSQVAVAPRGYFHYKHEPNNLTKRSATHIGVFPERPVCIVLIC